MGRRIVCHAFKGFHKQMMHCQSMATARLKLRDFGGNSKRFYRPSAMSMCWCNSNSALDAQSIWSSHLFSGIVCPADYLHHHCCPPWGLAKQMSTRPCYDGTTPTQPWAHATQLLWPSPCSLHPRWQLMHEEHKVAVLGGPCMNERPQTIWTKGAWSTCHDRSYKSHTIFDMFPSMYYCVGSSRKSRVHNLDLPFATCWVCHCSSYKTTQQRTQVISPCRAHAYDLPEQLPNPICQMWAHDDDDVAELSWAQTLVCYCVLQHHKQCVTQTIHHPCHAHLLACNVEQWSHKCNAQPHFANDTAPQSWTLGIREQAASAEPGQLWTWPFRVFATAVLTLLPTGHQPRLLITSHTVMVQKVHSCLANCFESAHLWATAKRPVITNLTIINKLSNAHWCGQACF